MLINKCTKWTFLMSLQLFCSFKRTGIELSKILVMPWFITFADGLRTTSFLQYFHYFFIWNSIYLCTHHKKHFFLSFRRTKTQHYWGNRRYGRCTSAFPQGSLCQSQRWCPRSFTAKWDRLFRSWKDEFSFANHVAWIAIWLHLCSFSCFPMETLHSFYQTKRLRLIHCVSEFCQSLLKKKKKSSNSDSTHYLDRQK